MKPYKTLKELAEEAGLKPIPFIPSVAPKRVKGKRRPSPVLLWECTSTSCKWSGTKQATIKVGSGKRQCPVCFSWVYPV